MLSPYFDFYNEININNVDIYYAYMFLILFMSNKEIFQGTTLTAIVRLGCEMARFLSYLFQFAN
jgi:hypothetical protein